MSENLRSVGTTRLKYDEIKPEQLISSDTEFAAEKANLTLAAIAIVAEDDTTQSPLARFQNLLVVLDQVHEIYQQTCNAAADYLRDTYGDIPTVYYEDDVDKESDKHPYREKDGVRYQLLQVANFRKLATKDPVLNSLLLSEKETQAALLRIEENISKRIDCLRATKEYQKVKPKEVEEILSIKRD